MEKPYLVFCCYARKDQKFLLNLKIHLKALEREELIILRADIDITPGVEWETFLMHNLAEADIILLLISPDFIASDYCFNEEMRRAIVRHEQGTARVIPVIVRPASWHKMPFGKLQALPKDAAPISTSSNIDTALLSVTKGIRAVVHELKTGVPVYWKPEENPLWSSSQKNGESSGSQERFSMDKRNDPGTFSINNKGDVYGQVIGGQHGQVISGHTIYINKAQEDGVHALEKGARALLNKDYSFAKKELRVAVEEIDQEQQKVEAAKARYLQMLAILGYERPQDKGTTITEKVCELLNTAISLDQRNAYLMTRAMIISPSSRPRANHIDITDYDQELLEYLKHCQPELYSQVCHVFGIQ